MRRLALACLATTALTVIAAPQYASAQTAPQNSEPVATVEDIIVTADRRARSLQEVPSAITAVTSEQLERQRIVDLNTLANSVPSFSMTEGSSLGKELNIRGITSVRIIDASAEPSVGMFVDEVYISRMGSAFTDFFDLERIEVIRGPQGVLLGKNVVGGAISVITAKPRFEPSGQMTVGLANYNGFNANGYVTGPLSDNFAGRFAFQVRNRDGYGENVVTDTDVEDLKSHQARAELLYQPDDGRLRALLTVDYGSSESAGSARTMTDDPFAAGTGAIAAWRAAQGLGPRQTTSPQREYANRTGGGAMLRLDYDFDWARLSYITGYRTSEGEMGYNQLGTASPPGLADTFYYAEDKPETLSQEIRLVSQNPDSRFDWIIGGFYQHDNVQRFDANRATTYTAIPALSGHFMYTNDAELDTMAVFGQVGFKITDQLKATVGARYTKDKKGGYRTATCLEDGGDGLCVAALVLAAGQSWAFNYEREWDAFTPQGIVEYRPNDDVMLYASVGKGFKGGGWDHIPATEAGGRIGYDPEEVINYEIGAKTDLFDNRVRLNVAAFQMDYKDLQSQQLILECLCTVTSNAGTAKIRGIEGEFQFAVTDALFLTASGSVLDAKYEDFVSSAGVDFSGNRIQRSPENKFDVGFTYEFGEGAWDRAFSLKANYTRTGEAFWGPENTIKQDAFGLVDASLRIQPPGADWNVTVWGKNLSDELYAVAAQTFFGDLMNYYGPPRTFGVDLRYSF
ncbi:TonB-dependent receptor [Brevundimonas sp. VNH65]|uniref:TonB-dependent receptor n=1 Tax=Brevundimonas sp. VNH65 TaxID=3400917 RepID=UPI003C07844F